MDFKLFWNRYKRYFLLIPAGAIIVIVAAAFTHYLGSHSIKTRIPNRPALEAAPTENNAPVQPEVVHIRPPKAVRSIYMTSWVGSNIPWRNQLVEFIKDSEINAVVIDIKDYSGLIAFDTQDPEIKKLNTEELRIRDFRAFIQQLHDANIYVIGRITVFQDPTYAKIFPSQAVQTSAGNLWADRNGLHYIDPSSQQYWDYIVRIGTAAANAGVDELNFDYIRFPTDGNMKDIVFPLSGPKFAKWATSTHSVHALTEPRSGTSNLQGSGNITQKRRPTNKERVLTEFFAYLDQHLAPLGIPISADLFGMTMTAQDDVNIGQYLESAAPYFDYICPMVYPSHYPTGFNGYSNPAEKPYEIVRFAMTHGVNRMKAAGQDPKKLRPWLQDFNLGAVYDAQKIRAQIQATYDSGLEGWHIWDPRNKYTRSAYRVRPTENSDSAADKPSANAIR